MDRVAFVLQNTRLFSTSILENVRASRPDASRDEVLSALHAAQCDDILAKLPEGVDTKIGSEGTYLSGGEQQRIALARANLKDAPIVVLDEATAFADPENEALIQKAFASSRRLLVPMLVMAMMRMPHLRYMRLRRAYSGRSRRSSHAFTVAAKSFCRSA